MEVVAEVAGRGHGTGTVLRTVRTEGPALAVRRATWTGTAAAGAAEPERVRGVRVHLVGTAAGPMGGDVVEVRVTVGPGACLEMAGVAATVVLPGRLQPRAELVLTADVAAGGLLVHSPPPLVVTGRAGLVATTLVRLVGDGQVQLSEHVRLGRHREPGGWWQGRTDVTRDGVPLLRQTTTLGEYPDGPRDLHSVLRTGAGPVRERLDPSGDEGAVVLDLASGGTLELTLR